MRQGNDDGLQFRLDMFVLLLGSFLFSTAVEIVSHSLLPMLTCVYNCSSYNWAQSVLQFLCDGNWKFRGVTKRGPIVRDPSKIRQGKTLTGCVHVLLLFFLEKYFPGEVDNYNGEVPLVYWTDAHIQEKLKIIDRDTYFLKPFNKVARDVEPSTSRLCPQDGCNDGGSAKSVGIHDNMDTSEGIQRVHCPRKRGAECLNSGDEVVCSFGSAYLRKSVSATFGIAGAKLPAEAMMFATAWLNAINRRDGRRIYVLSNNVLEMMCSWMCMPRTVGDNLWPYNPDAELHRDSVRDLVMTSPADCYNIRDSEIVMIPCCVLDHWFAICFCVSEEMVDVLLCNDGYYVDDQRPMKQHVFQNFVNKMTALLAELVGENKDVIWAGRPIKFRTPLLCPPVSVDDSAPYIIYYLRYYYGDPFACRGVLDQLHIVREEALMEVDPATCRGVLDGLHTVRYEAAMKREILQAMTRDSKTL